MTTPTLSPLPAATQLHDPPAATGATGSPMPDPMPDPVPDPATGAVVDSSLTPGRRLARAVLAAVDPTDVAVDVPAHLPASFPFFSQRPRYAVRHLLRTTPVAWPQERLPYVFEPPRDDAASRSGTTYLSTPEASVAPRVREAEPARLRLDVPVPAGVLGCPDLLADFVDHRVLVRTSVVENHALLHGSPDGCVTGLLEHPDVRRTRVAGGWADEVFDLCAEVEETGGSCDGMVVHPRTYWLLLERGLLQSLHAGGVKVSRTRMCPTDTVLLGDFSAAARLRTTDDSLLVLRGSGDDAVVEAEFGVALSVSLPQHLVVATTDAVR